MNFVWNQLFDHKKDLVRLEKAVDTKLEMNKKDDFYQYKNMVDVTRQFIKENNLLVYGGLAINLSLPKEGRFYSEEELPDYDAFSYDSLEHAKSLADLYKKKGYEYIEVRPGIHSGTYKVFVEFKPVADLTQIPKELYDRFVKISLKERSQVLINNPDLDLLIAPLSFLRLSFHTELSRPAGDIKRWPKVYQRMSLFYATYPLTYKNECRTRNKDISFQSSSVKNVTLPVDNKFRFKRIVLPVFYQDEDVSIHKLAKATQKYCWSKSIPLLGWAAVKEYLHYNNTPVKDDFILDKSMPLIECISLDFETTTHDIFERLNNVSKKNKLSYELHSALNNNELIPRHYVIYKHYDNTEKRPIVIIYESHACYAVKSIGKENVHILSIDAMVSIMYASLLAKRNYYPENATRCLINILLNLRAIHLHEYEDPVWNRFELNCYGYQIQMADIKRELWDHKRKFTLYRP